MNTIGTRNIKYQLNLQCKYISHESKMLLKTLCINKLIGKLLLHQQLKLKSIQKRNILESSPYTLINEI